MNVSKGLVNAVLGLALCASIPGSVCAQNTATEGYPARLLVTVEARHGSDVPEVDRRDVMVFEGHDRDQVTDWVPAQGDNAALDLFILLDDGSNASLGRQLEDLRKFIDAQPTSVKVGVAYMQNGTARVQQELTSDHALAGKALRLPLGIPGINASPYFSLSDLVKHWPASIARREVLMISDGIDNYYSGHDQDDPYLGAAIDDAQRAGIAVYAIYTPGEGHQAHSYWQSYWGQLYLAHLADDTGGEGYYIGLSGSPVSFSPYLDDMERQLSHQYFLTFNTKPQKKNGWQQVKVTTEVHNAEMVYPHKVYVSAAER
jgi:VWFA-related protein